jgi:hypothetical protein
LADKPTILVVEDDADCCAVLQDRLLELVQALVPKA